MLVTLRGFHLLDGLVAYDSVEARMEIVRGSGGGFVSGIVLTPRGSRRATLVKLVAWRIPILRTDVWHPLRV
jgi:hypothetical protein